MRRFLPLLPLLALLALVTACASAPGGGTAAGTSSAGSSSAARNDLLVEIHPGGGAATGSYRLTCGNPVTGNHPDGAAACAHLRAMKAPFAPLPAGQMCSQIYSGPQTAHVTGTWNGRPVDVSLSRTDGCRTAQWGSLGPLLPGPVATPTPR